MFSPPIRHHITVLLSFTLLFFPTATIAKQPQTFYVGQQIDPNLMLNSIDGQRYQLKNLDYPIVILHYWATWCPKCILEFPDMLDALRGMDNDIAIVAISLDQNIDFMRNYISKQNTSGVPIYWVHDKDMQLSFKQYRIIGTPENVFLNREHKVIKRFNDGFDWRTGQAWKELTAMVADSI